MHYFYGYARGNTAEAARLFREQVERRGDRALERWPDHRTILRVRDVYREGRVPGTIPGHLPLIRDPALVEEVIEEIERDPSVSVRTIELRTGTSKSVTHRILQSEGYHPYHIQKSGIVNEQLIGPFQLPDRLNGEEYLNFLTNNLDPLLEEIGLETRRDMYLQNDGAPCHYARIVRDYLNRRFGNKWIGRGGNIAWPPRLPDLYPIDLFVWGYYKEIVYDDV
ncbi:unnamed protein product [Euphydryas editha]|uniref:Transposase n=1 Tax=Euphydryas editha TaxID=104508 RepID=A0AAU9UWX0_EUPED|nr:unnamed protein product [Euphydryas editha]